MTRHSLFLMLLAVLSVSSWGHAQCPPGAVNIQDDQAAVQFLENYPDCQEIVAYLSIRGDVTDLSPLSNITSVGTYLSVNNTTQLASLAGLEQITSVGTDLRISGNDLLASIA
ncbi:MAG: hypothetical protein R3330_18985, partial [Saprospiraceae bacterium]|nr:hypothetical protein [Saprospiraceae bacterium]